MFTFTPKFGFVQFYLNGLKGNQVKRLTIND